MDEKRLKLLMPSKPQSLNVIREEIRSFISETPYQQREADILLVATEACANVVRHAYPKNHKNPLITVECVARPNAFTLTVSDKGKGLIQSDNGTVFSEEGGFGLFLMQKLSDNVTCYSAPGSGTMVEVSFKNPKYSFLRFGKRKLHTAAGLTPLVPLYEVLARAKGTVAAGWRLF